MPACTWQTIVYEPAFVNFRVTEPFVRTLLIVPFVGPLVIATSCGSLPVHWNLTESPFLMLSDVGPNFICGPTLTVFVAANAGTAMAAATTATATRAVMRRFMPGSSLLFRWGEASDVSSVDAGRCWQLPGKARVSASGHMPGGPSE